MFYLFPSNERPWPKVVNRRRKISIKGHFNSAHRFVNLALLTQCSYAGTDIWESTNG